MMRRLTIVSLIFFAARSLAVVEDFSIGAASVTLNNRIEIAGNNPRAYQVNLPVGAFTQTPAVFLLPDNSNTDPMTLRVYDVTTSGFKVFVSEPTDNFFGGVATNYPIQELEFLAIQPGTYTVDGAVLQVGLATVTPASQSYSFDGGSVQNETYLTVPFTNPTSFTSTPVVITELQTVNSDGTLLDINGEFTRATEPFLELVQRVPATNANQGFEVSLERLETGTAATVANLDQSEQIAWLAIEDGSELTITDDFGIPVEIKAFSPNQQVNGDTVQSSCDTIDLSTEGLSDFPAGSNPIYLASQITRNGFNGSFIRKCDSSISEVSLKAEEDFYDDNERIHINEDVNIVAISNNLIYTPAGGPTIIAGSRSIPANTGSSTTYLLTPTQVNFNSVFGSNFLVPPIVVPMTTDQGSDGLPTYVRVWDVTSAGFKIAQTVPEGETAAGQSMTVDFLAVVPGVHELVNGIVISAGTLNTKTCKGKAAVNCTTNNDNTNGAGGYETISFPLLNGAAAYATAPIVLAAPQTTNNDVTFDPAQPARPFMAASTIETTATDFRAAFDFAETNLGSPLIQDEALGWIAITDNLDTTFRAAESSIAGTKIIDIRSAYSTDTIQGWGNGGCYSGDINFPASLPLLVASPSSRDGNDGGWLRRCGVAGSYGFRFDEDRAADNERNHITEQAAVVAFSSPFAWTPFNFEHQKTIATISDPVNASSSPKAIPESVVEYSVNVSATSRIGIDQDSVSISDNVPDNTEFFIGNLDGSGCPLVFSNTGPASLGFDCNTDFLFVLKGTAPAGTCSPPTAGFNTLSDCTFTGDWTDLIESIKVEPSGELVGSTDNSNLSGFSIQFRVRVD